jgi:hypothetical protein
MRCCGNFAAGENKILIPRKTVEIKRMITVMPNKIRKFIIAEDLFNEAKVMEI